MFEPIPGLPDDTLGITASGTISSEDYARVLIPQAAEKMRAHGKIRMLMHLGPAYAGFSAGAMWEDAKFGFAHLGDFGKLALVSDVGWINQAARLFAPLIRCPVRIFSNAEMDAAKSWIAAP